MQHDNLNLTCYAKTFSCIFVYVATLFACQSEKKQATTSDFSDDNKTTFEKWIAEVVAQIRSIDPNHLISVGSEGKHGCEQDIALFERIHADKNIDYLTLHMKPYNWGWGGFPNLPMTTSTG